MGIKNNKQSGFGVIEIIIVLVIILILGALGFTAYNALLKPKPAKPVTTNDGTAAQAITQDFYAAYTDTQGNGAQIVGSYGTANLVAQSKTGSSSYSPIICTQYPAAVSTSSPTYADGRYKVPVTLRLNPPVNLTAEVVKVNGAFKIDKIDCPPRRDLG